MKITHKIIGSLCFLISSLAFAQGQWGAGGGRERERGLEHMMIDLIPYLDSAQGQKDFPEVVAYNRAHPKEKFADLLNETAIVLVPGAVNDGFDADRDCVSYFGDPKNRYVQCNLATMLDETKIENQPALYGFLFHEILVQAGIEKARTAKIPSDYHVSKRMEFHKEAFEKMMPGQAANTNIYRGMATQSGVSAPFAEIEIVFDQDGGYPAPSGTVKIFNLKASAHFVFTDATWDSSTGQFRAELQASESVNSGLNLELTGTLGNSDFTGVIDTDQDPYHQTYFTAIRGASFAAPPASLPNPSFPEKYIGSSTDVTKPNVKGFKVKMSVDLNDSDRYHISLIPGHDVSISLNFTSVEGASFSLFFPTGKIDLASGVINAEVITADSSNVVTKVSIYCVKAISSPPGYDCVMTNNQNGIQVNFNVSQEQQNVSILSPGN
jgi:hypothetical protein